MYKNPAAHTWLRHHHIAHVPGPSSGLADKVISDLVQYYRSEGHTIHGIPSAETSVVLTTARLGEPLNWRDALLFVARRRYRLKTNPTVVTVVHALPQQLDEWLLAIREVLDSKRAGANGFRGIPGSALETLFEQGRRGGEITYLLRVLQLQTKCIRVLLVVGEHSAESAYLFDLVGAHPHIINRDARAFIEDIALRIATVASTTEITNHIIEEPGIEREIWETLLTPKDMVRASSQFGRHDFFTEAVQIAKLASVPGFSQAISQQYSEGCFATWDEKLSALLTTITGRARPVTKDKITEDDLAVVLGIKPSHDGAIVRRIENHPSHPPSSEAVELIGMDLSLPKVRLGEIEVPVLRSKLHGHRGVRSFDKNVVEYVSLPESYHWYPVSCSTDAQYAAVQAAFSHSAALQDPRDPRRIVFTVLPGHGVIIAEKWAGDKRPFELIWEAMDHGVIEISNHIPQGPVTFLADHDRMTLSEELAPHHADGGVHAPG